MKWRGNKVVEVVINFVVGLLLIVDVVGKFFIWGFKEKKKELRLEGLYDLFGGLDFIFSWYKIYGGLLYLNVEKYRLDKVYVMGGYSFDEYIFRVMFEVFVGLGVFIEDERDVGVGLVVSEVVGMGVVLVVVGGDGLGLKMELD